MLNAAEIAAEGMMKKIQRGTPMRATPANFMGDLQGWLGVRFFQNKILTFQIQLRFSRTLELPTTLKSKIWQVEGRGCTAARSSCRPAAV